VKTHLVLAIVGVLARYTSGEQLCDLTEKLRLLLDQLDWVEGVISRDHLDRLAATDCHYGDIVPDLSPVGKDPLISYGEGSASAGSPDQGRSRASEVSDGLCAEK